LKGAFNLVLAVFFGLLLSSGAASAQQIQSMKLLTAQAGWAKSGQHLYWTADGGAHWKDITPPMSSKQSLSGVFFLDTSVGWAVLSYPNNKGEQQFRAASTADAGATWSSSPIKLPWKRYAEDFFGGGNIFFLDQLHGWVDLDLYSSSSFAPGRLLATQDGGKTWKATPRDSGRGGAFCFFSERDAVLAGGPQATELWVTHDASKTWQELTLKAPPEAEQSDVPTYGEPLCQSANRGFLPVTFSADGLPSALVLFATNDGGHTWSRNRIQSGLDENSPGQTVAATFVGSDLVFARREKSVTGRTIILTTIPESGRNDSIAAGVTGSDLVFQLSFVSSTTGWASTGDGLLSTTDGGATWIEIAPNKTKQNAPPPRCHRENQLVPNRNPTSPRSLAALRDSFRMQ
jgi:photosystem II stability/assembly factor-like uncharacterized protein